MNPETNLVLAVITSREDLDLNGLSADELKTRIVTNIIDFGDSGDENKIDWELLADKLETT